MAVVPLLVATFGLAAAAPAYAKKPSSGGAPPPSGSGACSVSPSTVSVGQDYTISGSHLGAYVIVNVTVTDKAGITAFNLQADANGNTSVVTRSYTPGSDAVRFAVVAGRGSTTVATCSVTVV
jgi:hypothetical protein